MLISKLILPLAFCGILIGLSFTGFSQGATCATADPFCTDNGANFPASTSTTAETGPNYGCLLSQPNPAWYYLQIDNSGNIDITLTNNGCGGTGCDIDFACWGPFSNLASACYPTNAPISCSFSPDPTETVNITGAVSGEFYLLLITNYSGDPTDISANQTGGTGSTDCSILTPCFMNFLDANLTACDPATGTFDISGEVQFTDPPTTGQLIVENCSGDQQIFNPPFTSPINYNITGITADGTTGCEVTAYFTADPACTLTSGTFTEPVCTCNMDFFQVNFGACETSTNTYSANGYVEFTSPPTTGQLIITIDDGINPPYDTIINPPFVSPQTWSISGMATGTGTSASVTVYFTADPACTQTLSLAVPANCDCPATAGTYTTTMTGNSSTNYILCNGDQIDFTHNNDFIPPADLSDPTVPYNPGIWWLIYSCPPTPGIDILTDPCFLGVISSTQNFSDVNDLSVINSFPAGTFTDNTVYYVPITMYDAVGGIYSLYPPPDLCFDLGLATEVTYLPEIISNATPDCQNSDVTVVLTGGYPELFGGNFTASNLSPATASFVNTTCAHGGSIVINGLQDGDMWSFDVVDANGCPITVSGGPFVGLPNAQAGVDDTICGALTYNLSGIPSFGTGSWTGPAGITFANPNSATSAITAAAPGTYTLTWTEDNGGGCISTDQVTISLSDPTFTDAVVPAICGLANGEIEITASGGVAPYSYSIDNGATSQATGTFTGLSANTYQGWIQDNLGCLFTQSITISNTGSPVIDSVVATDPLCNGDCNGQLIIYGSGGTPPYEYSLDGVTFVPGQDTWTGLCSGNQNVYIQDAAGCPNSSSTILYDPPALSVALDLVVHVDCNGDATGEIRVTASGGTFPYSYLWTGPGGPYTADDIDFLAAGTYDLVVTDDNGCTATFSETINEPAPLTITFSAFDASCAGACDGTAIVIPAGGTVAAGYNYSWSSGIAGNVPNAAGICPGTYDLTVTDDNGCTADTLGWNILGPPAVTFSSVIFTDETCNGSCDGTITVASASATQYSFNGGAFAPTSAFNGLCSGTYTITAADANGCSIDTTVTIGSPPAVNLTASPDTTICIGGTATITATASGGVGGFNYIWDSGELTATINVSPATNQAYCVTVTDANGCPAPAAACVNINLNPALQVTALSDQGICPGDVASISAIATGGDGNYSYTWDNGIGPGQTQNVAPGSTTVYTVTVTDGCETPGASDDLTITVNPLPTIDFTPDVTDGCTPVEVNFTEAGQPTGSQCFWDFGDGNASVNCGTVSNTYTDPGCYDVTLTVISDMGCTDQLTFPNLICVYPYPNAAFSFGPQPTSVMNTEIVFTNESTGATTYNWEFGTDGILGSSGETNPSFTFPNDNPGSYQVCLTATTDYGCQDSICQLVVIDEEFIVYVPNAFSPDDDNVNELFTPVVIGADPLNYKFMVFNRWGELIYDSQIIGQGWDGKYGGIPVQQDVYVWKLEVVNAMNNEKLNYKGHVTVLK